VDYKYAIKGLFTTLLLVNTFKNINILAILVISSTLLLITAISPSQASYGQISGSGDTNQANQTSSQNSTDQTQQQLAQANQQLAQANQQLAQANQTQQQVSNQTQQQILKLIKIENR
jgi:TolA-binding protein